jgi:hypothetical protein
METAFKQVYETYKDVIELGPYFTVGDEFQCVVSDPSRLFDVYQRLRFLSPVRFRCGFGIGDIEGRVSKDVPMRGSAFVRARDAIEMCKKGERELMLRSNDYRSAFDDIINTLLLIAADIDDHWTQRQYEVVREYVIQGRPKYEVIANRFNTSKQSISQVIIASRLHQLDEVTTALNLMLEDERVLKLRKAKMLDTQKSSKNA